MNQQSKKKNLQLNLQSQNSWQNLNLKIKRLNIHHKTSLSCLSIFSVSWKLKTNWILFSADTFLNLSMCSSHQSQKTSLIIYTDMSILLKTLLIIFTIDQSLTISLKSWSMRRFLMKLPPRMLIHSRILESKRSSIILKRDLRTENFT